MNDHPATTQEAGRPYRDRTTKSGKLNTFNLCESSQHVASSARCFQQLLRNVLAFLFALCAAFTSFDRHQTISLINHLTRHLASRLTFLQSSPE